MIRAATAGTVILDAGGAERDVVDARDSEYVYLEGLVLKGARNSAVCVEGAKWLVVRRCRIEQCREGVYNADLRRPGRDFYIADNVIIGPYHWYDVGIRSEEGVQVCGEGHVVCYNRSGSAAGVDGACPAAGRKGTPARLSGGRQHRIMPPAHTGSRQGRRTRTSWKPGRKNAWSA